MEKIFSNGKQKKAGVTMLISDKIDFKKKAVIREKRRSLYNNKAVTPTRGYNIC